MGGWVEGNIYIRVPLNGMCKFSVSKIKNYMIKFVEEYVKNNTQKKKFQHI